MTTTYVVTGKVPSDRNGTPYVTVTLQPTQAGYHAPLEVSVSTQDNFWVGVIDVGWTVSITSPAPAEAC